MDETNTTFIVNHIFSLIDEESLLVHRPEQFIGEHVELVAQEVRLVGLIAIIKAALNLVRIKVVSLKTERHRQLSNVSRIAVLSNQDVLIGIFTPYCT